MKIIYSLILLVSMLLNIQETALAGGITQTRAQCRVEAHKVCFPQVLEDGVEVYKKCVSLYVKYCIESYQEVENE